MKQWYTPLLLAVLLIGTAGLLNACKKSVGGSDPSPTPPPTEPPIKPQVDPPTDATIGFFMDSWQPKTFARPTSFVDVTTPTLANAIVQIDRSEVVTKISPSFYGANANIWMTQLVTEPTLMGHLQTIKPNVIRFPGGSISDVFFWNAVKGVLPAGVPAKLLNADGAANDQYYWFGKNNESWTLSVENYYKVLQQMGSTGMITINYGYARYGTTPNPVAEAAHMAAEWVRYDNGRTTYWEIGNENFGTWEAGYRIKTADNKDGQPELLTGSLYGRHFRVFADSMRKAAAEKGHSIKIGAVMVESPPESWWVALPRNWNSGLFAEAGNTPDFFIVHNYYTPYKTNANATEILATGTAVTSNMMQYVKQQLAAAGIAPKPIVLNEFNITSEGAQQQVSQVNGMHAVLVMGEALRSKYAHTARWDLANGWENGNDHGLFNIGDEPGGVPKWNPRPAFYHMLFFERFTGDRLVKCVSNHPDVIAYASSFSSGEMAAALVNTSANTRIAEVRIDQFAKGEQVYWYTLSNGDAAAFSRKVTVNGKGPAGVAGGPENPLGIPAYRAPATGTIRISVPGLSAVYLAVDKK